MHKGHVAYQEVNTMGLSQVDLILHVYRGTIGLLEKAKRDFKADRYMDGRTACEKAHKCIVHLYTTLNLEKGGVIADRLAKLYVYMLEKLDVVMANRSEKIMDELIQLLSNIKDGWEGIKTNGHHKSASAAPPAVKENEPDGPPVGAGAPSGHKARITVSA